MAPFGPEQDAAGGGPAPSAQRGGDATPTHLIGLCAGLTELLLAAAADPGLGGADTRAPLRRMEALAGRRCGGRTFLSGFLSQRRFLLPRSRSTDPQQRDEDINSPMSRGITQKSHRPRQESLSRSPSSSPHRRRRAPSTASRFPFPDARKKGSIDADRRQRQGEGGGAGVGTEDLIKDPIKNGQLTWGSVFGC